MISVGDCTVRDTAEQRLINIDTQVVLYLQRGDMTLDNRNTITTILILPYCVELMLVEVEYPSHVLPY